MSQDSARSEFKAIKLDNAQKNFTKEILARFEKENRGYTLQRSFRVEDGIIYVYFIPYVSTK